VFVKQQWRQAPKVSGTEVVDPELLHETRIIRDAEVSESGIVRRA
jgi:hypothetical protein